VAAGDLTAKPVFASNDDMALGVIAVLVASITNSLAVIFLLWAFGPRRGRSGVTG